MLFRRGTEALYANDPPKLNKCIVYGVGSFLFWVAVICSGYCIKDYQCAMFVYNYAIFWNALTAIVNVSDVILNKVDFYFWRPPDDILHFLTLLGGAPTTVLVMVLLKHNKHKLFYQETFFTWCGLSCLWKLFVLFIVYSNQQMFMEFFR